LLKRRAAQPRQAQQLVEEERAFGLTKQPAEQARLTIGKDGVGE